MAGRHAIVGRTDVTTREALLAAAHDLLATEGPGALSVRRIAAAAGMSTMNVYSRFGGKDGVLDELFVAGFDRLRAAMAQAPATDDPLADLEGCGAAYRRFAQEHSTYYSLMFDRVVPDYQPSAAAEEAGLATLGVLAGRVERAMAAGMMARRDPFHVAMALWAFQHGMVSLRSRTTDVDAFDWDSPSRRSAARRWSEASSSTMGDVEVRVTAPDATSLHALIVESGDSVALQRVGDEWVGAVTEGTVYGLVAEGDGPRFDPAKVLLDPPGRRGRVRSDPRPGGGVAAGPIACRPAGGGPPPGAATAGPPVEPSGRRLRGARPRVDPCRGWAGAGQLRRARRPVAAPRRPRRDRARAAARPPAGSAGGQLLGLHAAGVRRRRASSGRGR